MSAILELRMYRKFSAAAASASARTVAVEDVTFSIPDDSPTITALAGESGSGKTTLSRLLMGVSKPTKGVVYYNGTDSTKLSKAERKQFLLDVQPIYQDPFGVYNPFYKADHLLYVAVKKFDLADSDEEAQALIEEALETVGLRPEEISGPLSPPVERWPAPAHDGGACPAAQTACHPGRRTGLHGRRLVAGHHFGEPAFAQPGLRHLHPLRHP